MRTWRSNDHATERSESGSDFGRRPCCCLGLTASAHIECLRVQRSACRLPEREWSTFAELHLSQLLRVLGVRPRQWRECPKGITAESLGMLPGRPATPVSSPGFARQPIYPGHLGHPGHLARRVGEHPHGRMYGMHPAVTACNAAWAYCFTFLSDCASFTASATPIFAAVFFIFALSAPVSDFKAPRYWP